MLKLIEGDGGDNVEQLKFKVWKVSKGVTGVKVRVNGTVMDWADFVKFAFDITPRRLNQLLDIEDAPTQPKPKTKERKPWVKMETADYDAMKEQWDKRVESAGLKPEEDQLVNYDYRHELFNGGSILMTLDESYR